MEGVVEQGTLFPLVEEKAGRRSALRDFIDAVEIHGPVMPQAYVSQVLDVSRARVTELINAGRIARVQLRGKWFVPLAALEAFLADERKNGRPAKATWLAEHHPFYRKHLGLKNS